MPITRPLAALTRNVLPKHTASPWSRVTPKEGYYKYADGEVQKFAGPLAQGVLDPV